MLGNANPQRVVLKETQHLKAKLQECLQLSGTNSNSNVHDGQKTTFIGRNPVCNAQMPYREKESDCQGMDRPNHIPSQRKIPPDGSSHANIGNKENQDAAGKQKTAK